MKLFQRSGWSVLASRYPLKERKSGKTFHFVSGYFGIEGEAGVRFGGSLVLKVCSDGFQLSPLFILLPFFPSIFIPWSDIANILSRREGGGGVSLRIINFDRKILIAGKAGNYLLEEYERRTT